MAEKGGMSTLSTVIVFGFLIGLCLWLLLVLSSQGEQRLEQACKPVEYSTQFLHEMATTVAGRQPTWTLYVQRYLMTGCYYGFSLVFNETVDQNPLGGAVRVPGDVDRGGIQ